VSAPKPITEHLADLLRERSARGLEKYGTSIDRGDLSRAEWLQHLLEELLDAAQYVEAAKRQALASAASIPDGWALVPWTPLPSMLVAVGSMNGYAGAHGEADVDHIEWYEAMVAEAQTKLPAEAGAHSPNSVSSDELDPLMRECIAKAIGEAIHNAASKVLEQAATQMLAMIDAAPQPQAEPRTPIENLMAQYTSDGCDFTDMVFVRTASLRYVKTMPDSQARCLLYAWAAAPQGGRAEDVALVGGLVRQSGLAGPTIKAAWQRIEADMIRLLGVGRE